ncbi:regulator of hemoglobinization and erythroid cell expansion protein [Echinops telfairi]|uniref:Regulator of hemoglobinization and erythroid cell expansion protein n=1 Tax=Echinops telfairi TaxID=9371 RepID=A0ABM1VMC1_ECHTE|nr:regulator of hemoglobinization and erythroid cell expansion protein [Echinops telfairi]
MKVWHGLLFAAVSVFLQTCLLMALNWLLSRRREDSDTSSDDSSDSSDSSPSSHQAPRDVNYAQVVFPASRGLKSESALGYEDVKEATDYVNVNPQGHKGNIWTFVNHAASESVEYTQVAV